jgi:quercetin dioxygenase-like cupin family protein
MNILKSLMIGTVAVAAGLALGPARAADDHVAVAPDGIQWGPAPPAFPEGAEAAVLFGDPSKEGQFALRLKVPGGYHIAPHTHPAIENVTVISGSVQLGMGETASKDSTQDLPAGSFVSLPEGMAHYVYMDEETVLQLNTVGPWGLTYVNPDDDPRKTQ